jgi:hypothetical protein
MTQNHLASGKGRQANDLVALQEHQIGGQRDKIQ